MAESPRKIIPKSERTDWILRYFARWKGSSQYELFSVDVLDAKFACDYIEATGAKSSLMAYGAPKCSMLGRDLSELHDAGLLKRARSGIEGLGGMGFPKWVFSYTTTQAGRDRIELLLAGEKDAGII